MDLQTQFQNEVNRNQWWDNNQPVVVAVSTGIDSMVLLNLMQHLTNNHPRIIVAHVNHQLRQQSELEEQFLRDYCARHDLELVVKRWHHPELASGMEEQARKFRYAFFQEVMEQHEAHILVTAHQQNDQAETVLMKLARSGNLKEVTGIAPVRDFHHGKLVRPLLAFSRHQIEQYAHDNQINWFEDATNHDDAVQRNRIRHHVLPNLVQENPQAITHLADFATELQQQNHLVAQLLQQHLQATKTFQQTNSEVEISINDVESILEPSLQYLVTQLSPITLTKQQITEIKQLLRNQKKPQGIINLGKHLEFEKTYQTLKFKKIQNQNKSFRETCGFMVVLNHWYELSNGNSIAIFNSENIPVGKYLRHSEFWLTDQQLPLQVRPSQKSDRVQLKGGGSKSLRRVLIDHKIPNDERLQSQSLVTKDGVVLSILGIQESSIKQTEQTKLYVLLVK
ncbi:tRNA lysidine(34) synthetase TilS [Fructilactobacillus sp. Tb1]|uniref:tRNA lysidine(34) synthetase TilS n=1 Tax=Fructilactobacillus sp. Tb1 TaxID=3422304 RepID=UPI003D26FB40